MTRKRIIGRSVQKALLTMTQIYDKINDAKLRKVIGNGLAYDRRIPRRDPGELCGVSILALGPQKNGASMERPLWLKTSFIDPRVQSSETSLTVTLYSVFCDSILCNSI